MLRYEIERNGYAATINRLVDKYANYLTPSNNPAEGTPAMVLSYFPFNFPTGFWPVLAVSQEAPEVGPPRSMRDSWIRTLRIQLRIYHLSITPAGEEGEFEFEDGRETAMRATTAVWSNWFKAFEADQEMANYNIRMTVEMGDRDQQGRFISQLNAPHNILWLHSTTIEIAT